MVFVEALQALFNLDFGFFIDVFLGNLLWVFIYFFVALVFINDKRPVYSFVLLSIYLWAFVEFVEITAFKGFTGDPFLFFAVFAVLIIITDNITALKKHTSFIHLIVIYGVLLYFTFFLV